MKEIVAAALLGGVIIGGLGAGTAHADVYDDLAHLICHKLKAGATGDQIVRAMMLSDPGMSRDSAAVHFTS